MNRSETEILEEIEQGLKRDDAAFVRRMTVRLPLSTWHKVRFALLSYVGLMMVMMYSVNIGLAIAGYAVLITATIDLISRFVASSDNVGRSVVPDGNGTLAPSFD